MGIFKSKKIARIYPTIEFGLNFKLDGLILNYMDKQDFVVCFWIMFLRYLEGFCQKPKYHGTCDSLRYPKVDRIRDIPIRTVVIAFEECWPLAGALHFDRSFISKLQGMWECGSGHRNILI